MTPRRGPVARSAAVLLLTGASAAAQGVQEIPNPMAAHAVFIIAIVGAFLAWAVSFSIHTARERSDGRRERQRLLDERERILGRIVDLEDERESGRIDAPRYKLRARRLRGDLARVVEALRSAPPPKKKRA